MPGAVVRVPTENAVFQHLERPKQSQHARHRFGEFFVEGVKSINQARRHRWPIRSLVYPTGRPLSSWARETLQGTPEADRIELSPALMERLSDKHQTSDLVAVVGMPPQGTQRIPLQADLLVAVFDRPTSPGNLGSVIRSCHALGADGLLVTGPGTDIYHPLTVRASMGSLFALPTVRLPSHVEVGQWVRALELPPAPGPAGASHRDRGAVQIVGTSGRAARAVDAVDLTGPTVLVLGNEAEGLTPGYQDLCDLLVGVPMQAGADSVNVACAAAIVLYEADRQRRVPPREEDEYARGSGSCGRPEGHGYARARGPTWPSARVHFEGDEYARARP